MKLKTALFIISLIAVALFFPGQSFAGNRVKVVKHSPNKTVVVKNHPRAKQKVIVTLPVHHKKVMYKGTPYYVHNGVWYKYGSDGYTVIRAPRGARLTVLPDGHRTVVIAGIKYFYYYGTYYVYDPGVKDYCVVDAPPSVATNDVVKLTDGDQLSGTFLGGDDETVEFQVGEEIYQLDVSDIVSIHFEQSED